MGIEFGIASNATTSRAHFPVSSLRWQDRVWLYDRYEIDGCRGPVR
jgi:hypothetical protein